MTWKRWAPWLWAASIFATSSGVVTIGQLANGISAATGGHVAEDSFRHVWEMVWWIFVKGWHAAEFGILFLLIRRALPSRVSWALLLAALYAVADEGHQLLVPDRGCRASDVCIDWLGILGAYVLVVTPGRRFTKVGFGICCALAIFLLSVFPFGLVSLGSGGGSYRP